MTGIVTAKLRQVRPLTGHELPFLKKNSPGAIKMTLPSATQFPAIAFKSGVTDKVYQGPLRAAMGHRRHHEDGPRQAFHRWRELHSD